MNKTKATIKGKNNEKEKEVARLQQGVKGTPTGNLMKTMAAIGIVLVIAVCALVGYDQLKPQLILTVNDEKIYLNDAMYYIYNAEKMAEMYDGIYQQVYGSSYFDYVDEDGNTGNDLAKEEVMNNLTNDTVVYLMATDAGYTISDEDKKSGEEQYTEFAKNLSAKQKLETGMSQKELTNVLTKKAMADRYKKEIIASCNLDYDSIKGEISKEDYREYDVQYYYVSTMKSDEEGNAVAVSEEEKAAASEKIQSIAETAKTAEDFTKVVDTETDTSVTFKEDGSFTEANGLFGDKVDKKVKAMKNDEISEVLEGEDGYYVVKMINNNSTASYDEAVEDAVTSAENEAFQKKYDEQSGNYTITVNDKVWDLIVLGNYTI